MTLALTIISLKKKLQEPWMEMAKRIIRPLQATDPSRPSSEIRKANADRVPISLPASPAHSTWLLLAPHKSCSFLTPTPPARTAFPSPLRLPRPNSKCAPQLRPKPSPTPSLPLYPPPELLQQFFSSIHSPSQQIFIESLLCTRHCAKKRRAGKTATLMR